MYKCFIWKSSGEKRGHVIVGTVRRIAKTADLFTILGLIITGSGTKTTQSKKSFEENLRFMPSIHGEDNPFGERYWSCSYDEFYAGYWCPEN
jgi:hypothetical protein